MWGAAAITPAGAPKKGHVSVLEDGREGTGLLGWASSRVTGDCGEGEVGLALLLAFCTQLHCTHSHRPHTYCCPSILSHTP